MERDCESELPKLKKSKTLASIVLVQVLFVVNVAIFCTYEMPIVLAYSLRYKRLKNLEFSKKVLDYMRR